MMFAMRGIAVSLSVFVLVYAAVSLAVCAIWRQVWLRSRRSSARRCADVLFALRLFPFVTAAAVTLVFAVPSFLLLEPKAIDEPVGILPLTLGACWLALVGLRLTKATIALLQVSLAIAESVRHARVLETRQRVPVLRGPRISPALVAVGILRPRVLVSGGAEFTLSTGEMRIALRHELAHIRRRDNLKKLVLRCLAFPGMRGLETAWQESTEMAADDAAVSNLSEALDLAAALIKLSRLSPLEPCAELTTSFANSPAELVNARVARLIAWNESPPQKKSHSLWYGLSAGLAVAGMLTISYSQLLVRVHTATEWLVR